MVADRAAGPAAEYRVAMTPDSTRTPIWRGRYAQGSARGIVFADSPSPSLVPETRDRMCPSCRNRAVVALGPVAASATGIRCAYRCPTCTAEFVLVLAMRRMIETDWSTPGAP
jgi:DNA-directed RNA polymerase subunit RPC12/RpoP